MRCTGIVGCRQRKNTGNHPPASPSPFNNHVTHATMTRNTQASLAAFNNADAPSTPNTEPQPCTDNTDGETPSSATIPARTVLEAMVRNDTTDGQHAIELTDHEIVRVTPTTTQNVVLVTTLSEYAWVSPYPADAPGDMTRAVKRDCINALRGNSVSVVRGTDTTVDGDTVRVNIT